jgi:DNA-binding response OmpR family regulator
MPSHLLLVEDQLDFAANVYAYLEREGFTLDHAANGQEALARLQEDRYDLVILDLGLPLIDGMEVLKRTRAHNQTLPIIALTARDHVDDRVRGLLAGLDDYLVKPIDLGELKARILAKLVHQRPAPAMLGYGDLSLDIHTMVATRQQKSILLTPTLGKLLTELLRAAPDTLTHAQLLARVWDDRADVRTLHAQISNLRAMIDRPFALPLLRTQLGVGYALRAD